jgi:UDP-N-acetylmuramyl tripeptide synthase
LKKILDTNQTQYLLYSEKKLPEKVSATVHKRFPQNYNVKNSALITSIAQQLGIDESIIATAITTFPGVPGRMQEVKNTAGLRIVIDFALQILKRADYLLVMQKSKLIAIFWMCWFA